MPTNPHPQIDPPKPYHQRPGEPDLWYGRFHHFCLLGPSRTLLQSYRQIIGQRDPRPAKKNRKVSGAWLQKAKQFDWTARAAAWDADRRQHALQCVENTINLISEAACEALQFHIDLMNGYIKDHNAQMLPVNDIYHRRMAARTILNKAVEISALLREDQAQKRAMIQVTEIRVNKPDDQPS